MPPSPPSSRVTFDHLDKALCILSFNESHIGLDAAILNSLPLVRRVDLIVSPPEQYPFALVSWTGSRVSTNEDAV